MRSIRKKANPNRQSKQFLKDIATVYITVIRGTPLLVQIFIFYFIVATIFDIPRFYAGVISLGRI